MDHSLDGDSDTNLKVVEIVLLAVEDSSRIKKGCPALLNGSYHLLLPVYIKEGALLTGKGGFRQVFSGSRGTDSNQAPTHF